jgi:hypothetical protein
MARDVFISHSAQDKKVAETICGALEEAAIRCWVAPRDVRAGRSFPGEITRAIQQSKVMLLIFSRHSNSSEQVLREVQLAVDCHVPIVRLRIEDITLSDDLRYYLSTPQYLDALTAPLTKHIPRLQAAIEELLEQAADDGGKNGPAGAAPPLEVAAKNRPEDLKETRIRNWKPFAIGAAILAILAVLGAIVLTVRPGKEEKNLSVVSQSRVEPAPSATIQPTPTPTIAAQATPTPIAVAVAASPAAPERAQPMATAQPNPKGPAPRNNRTWQAWIDEFVHNFITSGESNDSNLALSFYAPRVDVFEEGWKTTDAIRRDIETYNVRWPRRRNTIRGDVRLSEKANRTYLASFEHDFYVENPSRGEWISGAAAVDLQITVADDGIPKVFSQKQKTLRREKGTTQQR